MYIETSQNDHGSVNVFVSFVGKNIMKIINFLLE